MNTRSGRVTALSMLYAAALSAVLTVTAGAAPAAARGAAPPVPAGGSASTGPAGPAATSSEPSAVDAAVTNQLAKRGRADVFVMLREKADLSDARRHAGHAERVGFVYHKLTETARRAQQPLVTALTGHKAKFQPLWLVDAVLVRGADASLVRELGRRADVSRVRLDGSVTLPEPIENAQPAATVPPNAEGVEWGVTAIRADKVWSTYGVRGEGIVVGSIDTGVQFSHPALAKQYRGTRPDGSVDHNYNWFDPAHVCPTAAPCDDVGHGSHTVGTMVGADAANKIGVAPGARWIAAKGCESSNCTEASLIAAGQWMLAPTDLNGQNPRPDLAPHIINNSWGGGSQDTFYTDMVDAWVQAGIFPTFSNGNSGPSCGSVSAPGAYANSYGVGAYDVNGAIAGFSSRGASAFGGEIKPNISAPGVNVRSSVPGNTYDVYSGTSMAAPHLSGAVALLWAVAPALIGDLPATRQLLDRTAVDVSDTTCGGSPGDNNVWGEGKLDIYSAAALAPRGPTGTVVGTVTTTSGTPMKDAVVHLTDAGGAAGSAVTTTTGDFTFVLPPGDYTLSTQVFGYNPATATVTVTADTTVRHDVTLVASPRYSIHGAVQQPGGGGLPAVGVSLAGVPVAGTTSTTDGTFTLTGVPPGTYTLVSAAGRCATSGSMLVTVDGDETVTLQPPAAKDSYGYECLVTGSQWVDGTTVLPLTGDDTDLKVTLPFTFPMYGRAYPSAYVSTNGLLNFERSNWLSINSGIPNGGYPNAAIYPFWDDLVVDGSASVRTTVAGTAPNRRFVIEWRNVALYDAPTTRLTFEVILYENGQIWLQYKTVPAGGLSCGESATVGIEDYSGTRGMAYSFNQCVLRSSTMIRYHGLGLIQGVVKDVNGNPVKGLKVLYGRTNAPGVFDGQPTDANGVYRVGLPPGDAWVTVGVDDTVYRSVQATGTIVDDGDIITRDLTIYKQQNTISGHVRDEFGRPVAGAIVSRVQQYDPPTTTTDASGYYQLLLPPGDQTLDVHLPPVFATYQWTPITVTKDATVDLTASAPRDKTDTYRAYQPPSEWVPGTDRIALTGTDGVQEVPLPFTFAWYGASYSKLYAQVDGAAYFVPAVPLPPPYDTWPTTPHGRLEPFARALEIDASAGVFTGIVGSGADQRFVIEWRNVLIAGTQLRVTFEIVLGADGKLRFQYAQLPDDPLARGKDVTVKIQNGAGDVDLNLMFGEPQLSPGLAIEYRSDRPA